MKQFFQISIAVIFLTANLLTSSAFAQENNNILFSPTHSVAVEYSYLKGLVEKPQPTIAINEDGTHLYGEKDFLVVECAATQISKLYENNVNFSAVELVRIRLHSPEDMNLFPLELAQLNSFNKLRYIQLMFLYDVCGDETDECLFDIAHSSILPGNYFVTVMYQLSISQ